MVVKIQQAFSDKGTAAIMQAEINKAEARGEFLKAIILSPAYRDSERYGDNGFLLIFDSATEAPRDGRA